MTLSDLQVEITHQMELSYSYAAVDKILTETDIARHELPL